MKTGSFILLFFLFSWGNYAQEPEYHHVFFDNSLMEESWFYSEVSYESPSFILNVEGRLPVESNLFFTPGNSFSLNYTSRPKGQWVVKLNYPQWRGKDFIKTGNFLSFLWIVCSKGHKAGSVTRNSYWRP